MGATTYFAITDQELRTIWRRPFHIVATPTKVQLHNGDAIQVMCHRLIKQKNWEYLESRWLKDNGIQFCNECLLEFARREHEHATS